MATLQLFDQLLQFPLFQGMSRDDLSQVAGHTKFDFVKLQAGRLLVKEYDACYHLFFLLNGALQVESRAHDHSYTVSEVASAPFMVQPEAIFGYNQRYTRSFTAQTDVNLVSIDKDEVVRLAEEFLVFRLNLLNVFATQTQKLERISWQRCPLTLRDRIIHFFTARVLRPAGSKTFYILMTTLANELNDSRLDISRALNQMQRDGLLTLHRGRIEIHQMERLLM